MTRTLLAATLLLLAPSARPARGQAPLAQPPAATGPPATEAPAPAARAPAVPRGVYETARRASVEILLDDRHAGTGWLADRRGLVMTAAHMFDRPGRRIEIISPLLGRLPVEMVAIDAGHDLALLRAPSREGGYPSLALAERVPRAGTTVYQFGAPIFRPALLQRGMIASDKPSFEFYGNLGHYARIVHVACTLQSGTSGGPWLDARGRIVGQQSGIMSSDGVPVGVAFMAPVDAIGALLAAGKSARTPTLGMAVEETWQQERDLLAKYPPGTEGLFLRVLVVDGPAARAGLEDWDLIVAADGKPVRRVHELLEIVRKGEPGRPLTLQVRTPEGERVARQVKLGHLEAPWSESVPAARPTATP